MVRFFYLKIKPLKCLAVAGAPPPWLLLLTPNILGVFCIIDYPDSVLSESWIDLRFKIKVINCSALHRSGAGLTFFKKCNNVYPAFIPMEGTIEKNDSLIKYYGVDLEKIGQDREKTNKQLEEFALALSKLKPKSSPKWTLIFAGLALGNIAVMLLILPYIFFAFSSATLMIATFLVNEERIEKKLACNRLENEINDRVESISKLDELKDEIELEAQFALLEKNEEKTPKKKG